MNITKDKFITITPEEGMVLTTFKEGDDLREYTSCKKVYAPLTADTSVYREITLEEDAKYQADKEAAMAEPEEE